MERRELSKYPDKVSGALAWQRAFEAAADAKLAADVAAVREEVRRIEQLYSSTFGESDDDSSLQYRDRLLN